MKGKNKCKILKEIRQKIADENDIPYVTRECGYQGECTGTCPKCEAELRYLEQELEKRRSLGKTVAVAAVAAGLSLSMTACVARGGSGSGGSEVNEPSLPTLKPPISTELAGDVATPLKGEIAPAETETEEVEVLAGEALPLETEPEPPELLGDVAYIPETTQPQSDHD